MATYKLNYTAASINEKLGQVKTDSEITTLVNTQMNNNGFAMDNIQYTAVAGNAGLTIHLWKCGRLVTLVINNTATGTINNWGVVGTIPAAYAAATPVFLPNVLVAAMGFYIGGGDESNVIRMGNGNIVSGTSVWVYGQYLSQT